MRYRALDANGDSTFCSGETQWLVNSPAAVAQAVQTRLNLYTGEWFLDTSEGTPYSTEILGNNTGSIYDLAIQERILNTEGVSEIVTYQSSKSAQRALTVQAEIDTIYSSDYNGSVTSQADISTTIGQQ